MINVKNICYLIIFLVLVSCSKSKKEIIFDCDGEIDAIAVVSADRSYISIQENNSRYKVLLRPTIQIEHETIFTGGKIDFTFNDERSALYPAAKGDCKIR